LGRSDENTGSLLPDSELARRCAEGDDEAWTELVSRYRRKVWSIAYQFTGRAGEAEELSQDIFVHLLSALTSFDSSGSLSAWVGRVARNFAIDHYRKRRRERRLVEDGAEAEELIRLARDPSQATDPYRRLERAELASWLRELLDRLPAELGEAVMLRDLTEMSYEEISELLGIPLGTVKSRINRGRLELARHLRRRRGEWDPGLGNER
jgi:RNA polymerase sigma-70 factor (ECF subfamily)